MDRQQLLLARRRFVAVVAFVDLPSPFSERSLYRDLSMELYSSAQWLEIVVLNLTA